MRLAICFIALIFSQLLTVAALADDAPGNVCQAQANALSAAALEVTQKYKPQLDQLTKDASRKSQQIKDESPNPSGPGAVLKFDIKVTSHDQEFLFNLPSATMKTQTVAMDVPELSSHRVGWSWGVPETKMVPQCIAGPPETVCDGGAAPSCDFHGCSGVRLPSCSVRAGPKICTDIPSITVVTHEASMDVPDVAMRKQEFKFDVPEFTLVQQRIVLKIPDFTLVNVSAQAKKTQDDSNALSKEMQVESASINSKMKVEMKTTMADKMQAVFSCNEGTIKGQRDKALLDIDTQIVTFTQKANDARAQKNDAVAAAIDGSIKMMVKAREQITTEFQKALDGLNKVRDQALAANAQG